jgi:hypothetical protein
LENPSTRSPPTYGTRPWPSMKFLAYANEMPASSMNQFRAPTV